MQINECFFSGNVGKDIELKYNENGTVIGTFSLALTTSKKVNGEWENKTIWLKITVWNKLAEKLENKIKKGDYVLVKGNLLEDSWVNNDGEDKKQLSLNCNQVEHLVKPQKTEA